MRHYQSKVADCQIYHVSAKKASARYEMMVAVLDTHLDGNTPASNEVRGTLKEWCIELELAVNKRAFAANGAFLYVNVNTGVSIVFLADYGYGDFAGRSIVCGML